MMIISRTKRGIMPNPDSDHTWGLLGFMLSPGLIMFFLAISVLKQTTVSVITAISLMYGLPIILIWLVGRLTEKRTASLSEKDKEHENS